MSGFLKKIGSILIYKEPQNEENGFELLEDENEGIEQDNYNADDMKNSNTEGLKDQDSSKQQKNTQSEESKSTKIFSNVENIDESKKNKGTENPCKPLNVPDNVSEELCVNLATIKQKFDMPKNQAITIREFKIGRKIKAFMAFAEGMVDKKTLNLSILPQLMAKGLFDEIVEECVVDYLIENVLTVNKVNKTKKYTEIVINVLNGGCALFIEGCSECILLHISEYEKRNIEQPVTETVVKGSQEAFTENLNTNLTLVRRIVKNEKLVTEMLPVGKMNNSKCAVLYLEGVASPDIISEVKKRIKRIDTDFIMGDGMVEQFIEDNPFRLFPQVLSTERPDRAAALIMEGRVAIITEGTPFAIGLPVSFFNLLHTTEDTTSRWSYGTFLRLIRILGLFCSTLLPGLYVAVILFHPEAIPTELLNSISSAKESVPFPTLFEVLILEVSFELIREGGVRVPSVIGQTLGIVGALILGQAAVMAGLVSPILVIVVSITALGNFAIPNYSFALAIRIERFFFIFAGAFLGLYGISLVVFILGIIACSTKSFGVPFFAPVAPRTNISSDVMIRYPIWMQKKRGDELNSPSAKRQGENVKDWSKKKNFNKRGRTKKS